MFWAAQLCRICTQINNMCYNIFEKENNRNIDFKFKKCLHLNVFKDDYKPAEICSNCFVKLNEYSEFIEMCHASDKKFESILYHCPPTEHIVESTQWQEKTQDSGVIVSKTNILPECAAMMVKYEGVDSLAVQPQSYSSDVLTIVGDVSTCNQSNLNLDSVASCISFNKQGYNGNNFDFQNQTVLRHSGDYQKQDACLEQNMNLLNYTKIQNNFSERIINTCNIQSNSAEMNHVNCTNTQILDPQQVEYNANTVKDLKAEQQGEPKKINPKFAIVSVESIKKSMKLSPDIIKNIAQRKSVQKGACNTKNTKPFMCGNCGKFYMRKLTLRAHMALHTNVRPYTCDICDKSFAIRWDLTCHQRIHTNLYRCSYCSKGFSVPSKLERHIRIHTGHRPYACTVKGCGRKFSDKRNLIGHRASHSDVRQFVCDICKKAYKTKSQVNDHMKVHSNEASHKCDICCKSYKWKKNLFMHIKKHNGYTCSYCDKDCEKLSVLIKHKKDCKNKNIDK